MEDRVRELEGFRRFLVENEKSAATIQKYLFEVGDGQGGRAHSPNRGMALSPERALRRGIGKTTAQA